MRLTRDEIKANRALFSTWQAPANLRASADALMDKVGSKDLFNQAGLEFITDAWAGAVFGQQRGAVLVRLAPNDRPDFELRFADGPEELLEIVEADVLGRRRGLEYRCAVARNSPVEEWATPEQARTVIEDRAHKKAAKAQELAAAGTPYPSTTDLLIYLNISDYGINHGAIVSEFRPAVQSAACWFASVWILWKDSIYQISERAG
jgi:hypothetical protein